MESSRFGVSFSVKQCRNLGIDWQACLTWALDQGWRRFRLMSYWNEIEKQRGIYDFTELDRQLELIIARGGTVTLCLGVKQPRWPEYHWPKWARDMAKKERDAALMTFIETVVKRYRNLQTIVSWQLENEALLRGFGERIDIDRKRLRREFDLVKKLDPHRPIIMSTSNSWGLPLRQPMPDTVGFSYYTVIYSHGMYHRTPHLIWLNRLRAWWLRAVEQRDVFIHELQLEPWGPRAIWEMDMAEQNKSMGADQIARNLTAAKRIGAYPIDLWGLEWWYSRALQGDATIWSAVHAGISDKS